MQLIPLRPVASQTLTTIIDQRQIGLNVYQRFFGLFVDVFVNDQPVIYGVLAHNLNRIVRYKYLGFTGDLTFADAQGADDPIYTGLGGRFELLYLSPDDLVALGLA